MKYPIVIGMMSILCVTVVAQSWNRDVIVAGDGVSEVGKYIDFHEADYDPGVDFNVRLFSANNILNSTGNFSAPLVSSNSILTGGIGIGVSVPNAKLDIFGNSPLTTNLILSANYHDKYRWRFNTADRGNAIDLDITASGSDDVEKPILKLSPSWSGRPEVRFENDWLVINDGNIGIGTSYPGSRLSVVSDQDDILHLSRSTGGAGDNIYLAFSHGNVTSPSNIRARIGTNIKPGGQGRLTFHTGTGGNTPEQMRIDESGNVGIGVTNPTAKLEVDGTVISEEVKVQVVNGPDYVFSADYTLPTLEETKAYIDANGHLPEIPSAKEMEYNGVALGEMNMLLLKKIEELTLYLMSQNQKIDNQSAEIELLKIQNKEFQNQLKHIVNEN